MNRSAKRILTTHCGSLPRPRDLLAPLHAKDSGDAYDRDALAARVRRSVSEVVRRQVELGIDVVNDGEHSKASFATYARARIGGLERTDQERPHRANVSRDALAFPAVYEEMKVMFGARSAAIGRPRGMNALVCTGPITYIGHDEVRADIDNLRQALAGTPSQEAFITAISPTNLEMYFANDFYRSEEEYLAALGDAMNQEYRAIVDAGFLLQIDDPRLITHYNRTPGNDDRRVPQVHRAARRGGEPFSEGDSGRPRPLSHLLQRQRRAAGARPGASALRRSHAEDQGAGLFDRGGQSAPRARMGGVAGGQAAARQDPRSGCGLALRLSGRAPELVAQRIERFASVVGRENVIAGNDCGFATSAAGDEVHADVAWAKLAALSEGARLATRRLVVSAAGGVPSLMPSELSSPAIRASPGSG